MTRMRMGMTFKRQTALTFVIGFALMCPLAVVAWLEFPDGQITTWQLVFLCACFTSAVPGFVLAAFGVLRIWGKFAYHFIMPRWPFWVYNTPQSARQIIADNPISRWIYWIDERGEDRDRDA